jgi:Rrf2 family protein
MKLDLTMRSDYAIRAMLALAKAPDKVRSSRSIALEMNIPPRFLPQIMADLGRAKLVSATAGRTGGYKLAASASATTLLAVIEAVGEDPYRQICVMRGTACGQNGQCDVHYVFYAAEGALIGHLRSASLQNVLDTKAHKFIAME